MDGKHDRQRRHRRASVRVGLRSAVPVLAVVAHVLLFGLLTASLWEGDMVRCLRAYDRAHTAADTASVDDVWIGGRNPRVGHTCGRLRREGTLDRHRRAMERRRAAAAGEGHAVIEK